MRICLFDKDEAWRTERNEVSFKTHPNSLVFCTKADTAGADKAKSASQHENTVKMRMRQCVYVQLTSSRKKSIDNCEWDQSLFGGCFDHCEAGNSYKNIRYKND